MPRPVRHQNVKNPFLWCVFCSHRTQDEQLMREHLLEHFHKAYFCPKCDIPGGELCDQDHSTEAECTDAEAELVAAWINRNIELQKKDSKKPVGKKAPAGFSLEPGCPVCDATKTRQLIESDDLSKDLSPDQILERQTKGVSDIIKRDQVATNVKPTDVSNNFRLHVLKHFDYYPYKCKDCQIKPTKKPYLNQVFDHVKLEHGNIPNDITAFGKTEMVFIPKLESFLRYYCLKRSNYNWLHQDYDKFLEDNAAHFGKLKALKTFDVPQPEASTSRRRSSTMSSASYNSAIGKTTSAEDEEIRKLKNGELTCQVNLQRLSQQQIDRWTSHEDEVIVERDIQSFSFAEPPSQHTYRCFVCSKRHETRHNARSCLYDRFKYLPISCRCQIKNGESHVICDEAVNSEHQLIVHYKNNHLEETVATFQVRRDEKFESWIEGYLDSRERPPEKNLKPCTSCPECFEVPGQKQLSKTESQDHTFTHLSYKPFECRICNEDKIVVGFSVVGAEAADHLKKYHLQDEEDSDALKRYFPYTGKLYLVELFCEDYVRDLVQKSNLVEIPVNSATNSTKLDLTKASTSKKVESSCSVPSSDKVTEPEKSKSPVHGRSKRKSTSPKQDPVKSHELEESPNTINESPRTKKLKGDDTEKSSAPLQEEDVSSPEETLKVRPPKTPPFAVPVSAASSVSQSPRPCASTSRARPSKIPCIFNKKLAKSRNEAFEMYCREMKFKPIRCEVKNCGESFTTEAEFVYHCHVHPELEEVMWSADKCFEYIWIVYFINSLDRQISEGTNDMPYNAGCYVCLKLAASNPSQQSRRSIGDDAALGLREHLHAHLKYYPFLCKAPDCGLSFFSVKETAITHLREEHNIDDDMDDNFTQERIQAVDDFIENECHDHLTDDIFALLEKDESEKGAGDVQAEAVLPPSPKKPPLSTSGAEKVVSQVFECFVCEKQFSARGKLFTHFATLHPQCNRAVQKKPRDDSRFVD